MDDDTTAQGSLFPGEPVVTLGKKLGLRHQKGKWTNAEIIPGITYGQAGEWTGMFVDSLYRCVDRLKKAGYESALENVDWEHDFDAEGEQDFYRILREQRAIPDAEEICTDVKELKIDMDRQSVIDDQLGHKQIADVLRLYFYGEGDVDGYWKKHKNRIWLEEKIKDNFTEVAAAIMGMRDDNPKTEHETRDLASNFLSRVGTIHDAQDIRHHIAGDSFTILVKDQRIHKINDQELSKKHHVSRLMDTGILNDFDMDARRPYIPGVGQRITFVRKGSKTAEDTIVEPFKKIEDVTKPEKPKRLTKREEERRMHLRMAHGESPYDWTPTGPVVEPEDIIEPVTDEEMERAFGGRGHLQKKFKLR